MNIEELTNAQSIIDRARDILRTMEWVRRGPEDEMLPKIHHHRYHYTLTPHARVHSVRDGKIHYIHIWQRQGVWELEPIPSPETVFTTPDELIADDVLQLLKYIYKNQ